MEEHLVELIKRVLGEDSKEYLEIITPTNNFIFINYRCELICRALRKCGDIFVGWPQVPGMNGPRDLSTEVLDAVFEFERQDEFDEYIDVSYCGDEGDDAECYSFRLYEIPGTDKLEVRNLELIIEDEYDDYDDDDEGDYEGDYE